MAVKELSQKEYLKRYLSGSKDAKKKKKKKATNISQRLHIVDDDIDPLNIKELAGGELDLYELAENAPQVVGIIDERPAELQALESFQNQSKWRVIADENEDLQVELINKKTNHREGSDVSSHTASQEQDTPPRPCKSSHHLTRGSDSDISPPRSRKDLHKHRRSPGSDISPPRSRKDLHKHRRSPDSDISPPRSRKDLHKHRRSPDSDISPPRSRKDLHKHRRSPDSDISPPRSRKDLHKHRRSPDSDNSPPRSRKDLHKHRRSPDSYISPPRSRKDLHKHRRSPDSDISPPRSRKDLHKNRRSPDSSPQAKNKGFPSDGKKYKTKHSNLASDSKNKSPISDKKHKRKRSVQSSDSDISPPRKKGDLSRESKDKLKPTRKSQKNANRDSNSELSPPRHKSLAGKSREYSSGSDLSPPRLGVRIKEEPGKMKQTLDGKAAGLQDAKTLKEETLRIKAKEQAHFEQMSDVVSGRGATTIVRDRKTGKKRDLAREAHERQEKEAVEEERLAEFRKLGKGLVQVEEQARRVMEHVHEMNKPLARYADDKDLENLLKAQEREGDPMLEYLREKKQQENPGVLKPRYNGPAPPPNRFNIMPGHNWDGVDRSTGFEKKLFESKNAKKAMEEEAYKWSVSDM